MDHYLNKFSSFATSIQRENEPNGALTKYCMLEDHIVKTYFKPTLMSETVSRADK